MSGLIPLLILLPLIGGLVLLITSMMGTQVIPTRRTGTLIAGINLAIAIVLTVLVWQKHAASTAEVSLANGTVQATVLYQPSWMLIQLSGGRQLHMAWGADGLGASMALLTTLVTFAVLVSATLSITHRFAEYAGWTLLAQSGLLLVFLSMDILSFYVGFELALLPLLALIAGWGEKNATAAAKRFVLYTLAGSIPMVVALVAVVVKYSSIDAPTILFSELSKRALEALPNTTASEQFWIFALLILGLGIKMALLPVHTWLPTTYQASHPTTAALLAAVVLKLGIFGLLRIVLPLVPAACAEYGPSVLGTLGAVAIVYGALAALAQTDLKLLLAYSSLSHVGFITVGLFALNQEGVSGAAIQMFNHGITTAAMFLLASSLITRRGTSNLLKGAKGLASIYPRLAVLMVFFVIAGAGMPGLNNFVGEMMALTAMVARNKVVTGIAALGVVLGAWYALRLVRDLLFGLAEKPKTFGANSQQDLRNRESIPLLAMVLISIFIGVVPQTAMTLVGRDTNRLSQIYKNGDKAVAPTPVSSLETRDDRSLVAVGEAQ